MRNLAIILGLGLFAAAPASAYENRTIGAWTISGEGGVCTALFRQDDDALILVSADEENHGGFAIFGPGYDNLDQADWTGAKLLADGEVLAENPFDLDLSAPGVWFGYDMIVDAPQWPDSMTLTVERAGQAMSIFELGDLHAAVEELNLCDSQV